VATQPQLAKRNDDGRTVSRSLLEEEIGILGGVRISEEYRARLSDEQVPDAVARGRVSDLFGLGVFKPRGHSPAIPAAPWRTMPGTPPSCRRRGSVRRRGPACTCGWRRSACACGAAGERPLQIRLPNRFAGDRPPARASPFNLRLESPTSKQRSLGSGDADATALAGGPRTPCGREEARGPGAPSRRGSVESHPVRVDV